MQNVINSLAVLGLLGTVISLFAVSALLRMVSQLRQELTVLANSTPADSFSAASRRVERFADADGRALFVLVVEEHCHNCEARSRHLAEIAGQVPGRLALLTADPGCAEWVAGTGIAVMVDSKLLGQVAVGATPTLLKYGADGAEQWRRVAGSDADLDSYLEAGAPASV
ncbi:hypothetical protein QLQ12_30980 [Actinoplanes sp. NEAU-A12]|uniref:Thioredoxin domain-containing protein n=1 Tax=Actinoplanes sandaracinus TaxID=3045177 RepID=A0ABT6WTJ2_9ACTN|nr:hypothetical protein [Actinoplanes sandaracinus]MDI6103048.1 hypothetical protein [Actinoplanes sandaracinus]